MILDDDTRLARHQVDCDLDQARGLHLSSLAREASATNCAFLSMWYFVHPRARRAV